MDKLWYTRHPLRWLLLPFAALFWLITTIRKTLFALGIKASSHPGVPVLIVGNISVGGNGKTPVVLKTVEWLLAMGYSPGILSRGYGGSCTRHPHRVEIEDKADEVGDEPSLMAKRALCPVVIDPARARGATALVECGCDVIVCDDGLQHYGIKRDIEWVVMDDRGIGNGGLLPMGPLRELPNKLNHVDAIIHNGSKPMHKDAVVMSLQPTQFVNVRDPSISIDVEVFLNQHRDESITAIAGIGSPERYFATLAALGFTQLSTRGFIDHHKFSAADIPESTTLMTEKDAVKCAQFAHKRCWYLKVDATLPNSLQHRLSEHLQRATADAQAQAKT